MRYVFGRIEISTEDPSGKEEDMKTIAMALNDDYLVEETDPHEEMIVGVEADDGHIILYMVKVTPRVLH